VRVAIEATYGWEWMVDFLQDAGVEVHLAHPLMTRAIAAARVKNDAVDAATLARLLAGDLLPEAYIAPRAQRDARDLVRQRIFLVRLRAALRNRVHAMLTRQGVITTPPAVFGPHGEQAVVDLGLRVEPTEHVQSMLRVVRLLSTEIAALSLAIRRYARTDPRVELLCQLRGIGPFTALLVITELGDVHRFPSARHVASWAGLTPRVRQSDTTTRVGHITKQGSITLRWALVEAAQHVATGGGPLRESFERIAKRRGRKIAKVAIARQLLECCYYALRDGEIRRLKIGPAGHHEHCHAAARTTQARADQLIVAPRQTAAHGRARVLS
jgi:transposase